MINKMIFGAAALILALNGCDEIKTGESTKKEMEQTESNQQRLVAAQPPPQISVSLERRNLIKRLERLNKENQISYIYLISYGKVMAFYTVSGKVSSLNSLLTTPEQVVNIPHSGASTQHVLPSPDLDGSYGKNPEGIFFFDTSDRYIEWSGDFLWSDQLLKLTQPPELVINIEEKKPSPVESKKEEVKKVTK